MNKKQIAQLQRKAKRFRVTHDAIAKEAGVTRPMVSHVFHYRAKSQKVLDAAERLISKRITDAQELLHVSAPAGGSLIASIPRI